MHLWGKSHGAVKSDILFFTGNIHENQGNLQFTRGFWKKKGIISLIACINKA